MCPLRSFIYYRYQFVEFYLYILIIYQGRIFWLKFLKNCSHKSRCCRKLSSKACWLGFVFFSLLFFNRWCHVVDMYFGIFFTSLSLFFTSLFCAHTLSPRYYSACFPTNSFPTPLYTNYKTNYNYYYYFYYCYCYNIQPYQSIIIITTTTTKNINNMNQLSLLLLQQQQPLLTIFQWRPHCFLNLRNLVG